MGLIILALVIIAILCWQKKALYDEYRYPNEDFYGKELYSEICYDCSAYEAEIGNALVDKAIEVAKYTGTEEAEKEIGDVGALSRFYYYNSLT